MLGAHAEEPSEPFAPGRDLAVAAEHYRTAASAALAALAGAAAVADSAAEAQQAGALPLRAAGGDETRLARLQAALEQPAAGFALLSAEEQPQRIAELRAFATTLTEACRADEAALERLHRQRRWRVAVTATVLALALFRVSLLLDGLDFREDLAAGKPWQTSSVAYHCEPDAKRCGNHFGMTIFFHTGEEESPWLQIDLQQEQSISAVRVRNRTDCCSLLAIPLVVELSSDGHTWHEVARRNRNFRYWVPEFAPTSARWVRLRVERESILHLEQVSVYR
ncbi:MAG: hypothetical protein RL685_1351 [Pseudomonadota bacterium]|jgi:hypothetical protein